MDNFDVGTTPLISPCYTLSEAVEEYLLTRGIDKKKYFVRYLAIGQRVWQELFWNTLWITKNVWQTLKMGEPYPYIDIPKDCVRIFSVNRVDHCGRIVPLWYNSQLNIISLPTIKKCGCDVCDCSGTCEDVNGFTLTTTLLFTINNINYYEKTWLKYCTNGDILEYREVPTKKYLDYLGDGGDFNEDFSDDFNIAEPPFSNFEIVTEVFQRKICKLTVKPCGCPEETPQNHQLLIDHCSCFLSIFSKGRRDFCKQFMENPDPDCLGQVKISECGTRIYYRAHRNRNPCCPTENKLPDFLQISYQTSGKNIDQQTQVPDYSLLAMWTGIDYRSKMFNNRYSLAEKTDAKYQHNDAVNKLIQFLNPLSLEVMSHIQDAPILW